MGDLSLGCKIINRLYKNGMMIGFKWLRTVAGCKYVYSNTLISVLLHMPCTYDCLFVLCDIVSWFHYSDRIADLDFISYV
jgi:hypothetical protein